MPIPASPCRPRFFFRFTHPAPPVTYTLSLHDALPIFRESPLACSVSGEQFRGSRRRFVGAAFTRHRSLLLPENGMPRSEEHTSELQSLRHLVCRLLLEKKNTEPLERQQPSTSRTVHDT